MTNPIPNMFGLDAAAAEKRCVCQPLINSATVRLKLRGNRQNPFKWDSRAEKPGGGMGAHIHARFSSNFYTVAADQCKLQRQSVNRTAKNRTENKTQAVERYEDVKTKASIGFLQVNSRPSQTTCRNNIKLFMSVNRHQHWRIRLYLSLIMTNPQFCLESGYWGWRANILPC